MQLEISQFGPFTRMVRLGELLMPSLILPPEARTPGQRERQRAFTAAARIERSAWGKRADLLPGPCNHSQGRWKARLSYL